MAGGCASAVGSRIEALTKPPSRSSRSSKPCWPNRMAGRRRSTSGYQTTAPTIAAARLYDGDDPATSLRRSPTCGACGRLASSGRIMPRADVPDVVVIFECNSVDEAKLNVEDCRRPVFSNGSISDSACHFRWSTYSTRRSMCASRSIDRSAPLLGRANAALSTTKGCSS
jgi:hypothetical protein